ncbi:MAG: IS701 family transposase [Acidimicrobiales bacterium]
MWTTEDQTVAAGHSVTPARWQTSLDVLLGRVAGRFGRVEPRRRAKAFVLGLLADLPRKNCWTIAEHAGDPSPDGMQHLLSRAVWDHDAVRDDIRAYLVEQLGDPEAVLVVDETGDLKKGTTTVGVKRQYTGTAGRVENAQVAVYLVYATDAGHAVIDRELYLPRSWTDDPARLQAAGVPEQVGFATKPALATAMITRALDAGVPAAWVTGDEVYGANPGLRAELEARQIGYVLTVACDHPVGFGGATHRADALLRQVPARAWQQVSCGKGAKGHRHYDWAFLRLDHHGPAPDGQAGKHWLMIRRNRKSGELAFYRCYTPRPVPLAMLVRVAGRRWTIEERLQTSKGLVGLDQHQVRRWRSWYRWVTLAMLAHAFLVVAAVTERICRPPPPGLIRLTCNEVQHLYAALVARPAADAAHRLRWSTWRRRHQARARTCHYQRQAACQP